MGGTEDENYYGKQGEPHKHDPNFKGPVKERGCTDIICCILPVICIIGYFIVGIVAWTHKDPRKVIYPTDSRGQFRGQAGTPNENKPFLFYFNIIKCASPLVLLEFQCPTTQICVEKCPDRYMTYIAAYQKPDLLEYYKNFCVPGFRNTGKSLPEVLRDKECPAAITPSKPLSRRCLPAISKSKGVVTVGNVTTFDDGSGYTRNITELVEGAKKANVVLEARQVAMKIFEDYTVYWYWIIIALIIAMVISLVFVVLLRFLAGIMIWVMIVLVIAILGYGIFHCSMEYVRLKGDQGSDVSLKELGMQTDLRVYLHIRQTWLAFIIILCILEVVIILLLIFLRKRILLAIALIKEASRAIGYIMSSLFFPLITFLLVCLCIAYWAITAVFLSTSQEAGYKVFNESSCEYSRARCDPETFNTTNITKACPEARCLFAFYGGESQYHKYLIFFQIFNAFMFLWLVNIVIGLGQVTLAVCNAQPEEEPAQALIPLLRATNHSAALQGRVWLEESGSLDASCTCMVEEGQMRGGLRQVQGRALKVKKLAMETEHKKLAMDERINLERFAHERSLKELDLKPRQAESSSDGGSLSSVPSDDKRIYIPKGLVPDSIVTYNIELHQYLIDNMLTVTREPAKEVDRWLSIRVHEKVSGASPQGRAKSSSEVGGR
ncbi:choline transporter-like protein 2 [Lissotriton helveticus]